MGWRQAASRQPWLAGVGVWRHSLFCSSAAAEACPSALAPSARFRCCSGGVLARQPRAAAARCADPARPDPGTLCCAAHAVRAAVLLLLLRAALIQHDLIQARCAVLCMLRMLLGCASPAELAAAPSCSKLPLHAAQAPSTAAWSAHVQCCWACQHPHSHCWQAGSMRLRHTSLYPCISSFSQKPSGGGGGGGGGGPDRPDRGEGPPGRHGRHRCGCGVCAWLGVRLVCRCGVLGAGSKQGCACSQAWYTRTTAVDPVCPAGPSCVAGATGAATAAPALTATGMRSGAACSVR